MRELNKIVKKELKEINDNLKYKIINNTNEIKFIDFKLNLENLINDILQHHDIISRIFLYTTTKFDIMDLVLNSSNNITMELVDKINYKTYGVVNIDIYSNKNYCINEIKLYK